MIFGLLLYLFFFKQKTAYEMRISDWSSDVCSSDLRGRPSPHKHIRLTQLRDDLFRRKTLTSHNFLQFFRHNRLSLELDQFFQGRPNHADMDQIGRASCRERVCKYDEIPVVTVSLKKKNNNNTIKRLSTK